MKCCVCGTTNDLRCAPIMTGDKFSEPTKHPVCGACVCAWYEDGGTTPEQILEARRKDGTWPLRVPLDEMIHGVPLPQPEVAK